MISRYSLFSLCAAAVFAVSVAACNEGSDDVTSPTNVSDDCRSLATSKGIPTSAVLISLKDSKFSPDTLRITRNTTVYWIQCESSTTVAHTISAVDGTWRSDELRRGGTFSRAFPQAVPTPFYSVQHPEAKGTLLISN